MPSTRPKRKTAEVASQMFTSVLKPVTVSSSSLESAGVSGGGFGAAAAAARPNEAPLGGLDHFDFDDFGTGVDPYATSSVGFSHPGAARPVPAAAASAPVKTGGEKGAESEEQAAANTIPEFLYQLTKLLTDENRDAIEWNYGRIEVHNPHKLEVNVLKKYFRHSKYASFQRQLNYFGWRKLNGKGKMAPCTYINDEVTPDIQCLLTIKRKVSIPKEKPSSTASDRKVSSKSLKSPGKSGAHGSAKRARYDGGSKPNKNVPAFKLAKSGGVKHQLNGFLKSSSSKGSRQATLAQTAVGRGIRHGYSAPASSANSVAGASAQSNMPFLDPTQLGMGVESSLSQLTSNYLKAQESEVPTPAEEQKDVISGPASGPGSMLTRNDSLVDLAMLPSLPFPDTGEMDADLAAGNSSSFTFVDFPDTFDFSPPSSGGG